MAKMELDLVDSCWAEAGSQMQRRREWDEWGGELSVEEERFSRLLAELKTEENCLAAQRQGGALSYIFQG